jgi:hypothetical protein
MGNHLMIVRGFPFHYEVDMELFNDYKVISHTIRKKG